MSARETEQPVVCAVCDDTGWLPDDFDSGAGLRCKCPAGAAADESEKSAERKQDRVRVQRMVSLHARWLVDAAEYREIAKTSMAANRMLSHQLHTGRAEMLEQCAAELRAGMKANVRMSDAPPKPSDSPSACKARSTPSAGSGNPGITAARESQNKPGGERAEFPKPTH